MQIVTTLLELAALVLLVASAYVFGGLALALLTAALCCLATSWRLTRPAVRR